MVVLPHYRIISSLLGIIFQLKVSSCSSLQSYPMDKMVQVTDSILCCSQLHCQTYGQEKRKTQKVCYNRTEHHNHNAWLIERAMAAAIVTAMAMAMAVAMMMETAIANSNSNSDSNSNSNS